MKKRNMQVADGQNTGHADGGMGNIDHRLKGTGTDRRLQGTDQPLSTTDQPRRTDHQWMDEWTRRWIGFDRIWRELQPISVYGSMHKTKIVPYRPGEERAWQTEIRSTGSLQQIRSDEQERYAFEEALRGLKDIRSFLYVLHQGESGTQTDWFDIKQCLLNVHQLFTVLQHVDPLIRTDRVQVEQLLSALQPEERSLGWPDIDPQAKAASDRRQQQLHRLQTMQREKRRNLEEELGTVIQHHTVLFVNRGQHALTAACAAHPLLEKEKQTPFEIWFKIRSSPEEQTLQEALDQNEKELERMEKQWLSQTANTFRPFVPHILSWLERIGCWDWRWVKWSWFEANDLVWPQYGTGGVDIQAGIHPYLRERLSAQGQRYTPVDVRLKEGLTTIVGSNMGGKSAALKTVGLLAALAHHALPVFARSMKTCLFQRCVAVSGDLEDTEKALSTFGAEIQRLVHTVEQYEPSLLLMDEVARGTNPYEGEALVIGLCRYLSRKPSFVSVLVTHFPVPASLPEGQHYRTGGLLEDGTMDYALYANEQGHIPGHALRIAAKMGMPDDIVREAERWLRKGENSEHGQIGEDFEHGQIEFTDGVD